MPSAPAAKDVHRASAPPTAPSLPLPSTSANSCARSCGRQASASPNNEAVAALMGLGIAEPAARRVVESAAIRLGRDSEAAALIKAALQELGR